MYLKVVDKVSKLGYYRTVFKLCFNIKTININLYYLKISGLMQYIFSTLALFVPPSIGLIMDQNHQRSTNNTYPHF